MAFSLNADCVELHTGDFCNSLNKKKAISNAYKKLRVCAELGKKYGLEVHAGHGLTFESAKIIRKIKDISEFNIGHFLVAESLFISMKSCIKKFKKIINNEK
jgi:pyridoxine 5-phosphate synthase